MRLEGEIKFVKRAISHKSPLIATSDVFLGGQGTALLPEEFAPEISVADDSGGSDGDCGSGAEDMASSGVASDAGSGTTNVCVVNCVPCLS